MEVRWREKRLTCGVCVGEGTEEGKRVIGKAFQQRKRKKTERKNEQKNGEVGNGDLRISRKRYWRWKERLSYIISKKRREKQI